MIMEKPWPAACWQRSSELMLSAKCTHLGCTVGNQVDAQVLRAIMLRRHCGGATVRKKIIDYTFGVYLKQIEARSFQYA
jgi:hypothetical protein